MYVKAFLILQVPVGKEKARIVPCVQSPRLLILDVLGVQQPFRVMEAWD